MPNHPGAELQLNKQCQGPKQDQLFILQWNSNGILREVAALEAVLPSLQVDIECIQETKLLPKDKTAEIPQYRTVRLDRQILREASGGGILIYIRASLAFSAVCPTSRMSSALEKLAVAIQLP